VSLGRKHRDHSHNPPPEPAPDPGAESSIVAEALASLEADDSARAAAGQQAPGAALVELPAEEIQRLEAQVAEWKDRTLRGAADLENFRRRANRERDEAFGRGQGDVLGRIVEVIDDLARVAHLDPAQTSSEALHEGMLAIERKFLRTLESAGVERVDPAGQPFDPRFHEAVAVLPAPSGDRDQTVGAVYQHGYLFKGVLLRPARVAVLAWTPPAEGGDA
jgi:molecular chaperone GrpE